MATRDPSLEWSQYLRQYICREDRPIEPVICPNIDYFSTCSDIPFFVLSNTYAERFEGFFAISSLVQGYFHHFLTSTDTYFSDHVKNVYSRPHRMMSRHGGRTRIYSVIASLYEAEDSDDRILYTLVVPKENIATVRYWVSRPNLLISPDAFELWVDLDALCDQTKAKVVRNYRKLLLKQLLDFSAKYKVRIKFRTKIAENLLLRVVEKPLHTYGGKIKKHYAQIINHLKSTVR